MLFLKGAGLLLIVLATIVVVVGFFLRDDVVVTRSTVIAAEPGRIHPHIATLRSWPQWSIWNLTEDPKAVFTYEGLESGVGAKWHWRGGDKFKNGWLEVVESDPDTGVRYTLMADGFRVDGGILYTKETAGTRLTWTDTAAFGMGPLGGWLKLLLGGMVDREQGGNQERSLAGLKKQVEAA
jgi:hypothetical protein